MPDCTVMADAYGQSCLPHTGLDLWPIVLIGIALLVTGAVLLRLAGPSGPHLKPDDWQQHPDD